ncbi:MAG: hypothetical protein GY820_40840 [Gammaproteobacteria bacterium]|nr:hypothetical protein [Gammaproteobacteria bacterium]
MARSKAQKTVGGLKKQTSQQEQQSGEGCVVVKVPAGRFDKVSRSKRAGIQFPVARVVSRLKKGNYAKRIGAGASVYLAAVMEYLAAEELELAGNAARDHKKVSVVSLYNKFKVTLQLQVRIC